MFHSCYNMVSLPGIGEDNVHIVDVLLSFPQDISREPSFVRSVI
jgi:hypothetical protein